MRVIFIIVFIMTMMTVCMHHQLSVLRVILISILFITIMMTLRTLKCFQIIEHRRARPSPKPKPKPTSTDAEAIARKLSEHYYTKAQADEKIDKIEQTIRIITKNADKYLKQLAKDLYK